MKFEPRHEQSALEIKLVVSFITIVDGELLNLDLSGIYWFVHPQSITIFIDPFDVAVSANPEKPP